MCIRDSQEPVENSAPAGETSQEGGSGLDMSQGLESVSLEQLYHCLLYTSRCV